MAQVLVTLPNGKKVIKESEDWTKVSQENFLTDALPGVTIHVSEK